MASFDRRNSTDLIPRNFAALHARMPISNRPQDSILVSILPHKPVQFLHRFGRRLRSPVRPTESAPPTLISTSLEGALAGLQILSNRQKTNFSHFIPSLLLTILSGSATPARIFETKGVLCEAVLLNHKELNVLKNLWTYV